MSDGCQHICSHGGISPSTDVKRMRANWGAQYNQGASGVCIYIYSTHTHGPLVMVTIPGTAIWVLGAHGSKAAFRLVKLFFPTASPTTQSKT